VLQVDERAALEKQEKEKEPELWKKAGKQGSDTDR
jgi:hypothetical protein